jgi:formylglycine-generating enzyme required for sulfatase activity
LFASLLTLMVLAGCGPRTEESQPDKFQVINTRCGMDMISIPAGQFTMGVSEGPIDAKPAHQVKVDGFLMDHQEITQEVYKSVTGKNPSRRKNPKNPVEQVTWSAAVKFCMHGPCRKV